MKQSQTESHIKMSTLGRHEITGEVLALFEQDANGCQWSAQQFNETLAEKTTICLVSKSSTGFICGYCLLCMLVDDLEVLQITVSPKLRRQGIGWELMNAVVECAKEQSYQRVLLEVNVNNESAIVFYQRYGFDEDGIRKGYYLNQYGKREDGLLMSLTITH